MVTTSSTKKVTLKAYQQNEKDKKAAQRKAATNKGANGRAYKKTTGSMVHMPGQLKAVVPQIVITETTDTFVEQSKQVNDTIGDIHAGVFLQVPTAEVDNYQFASEADEVLEAPAEEFHGVRYIVPSKIDMAYQQVVVNHERPQVLYHRLNDHARHAIEAFMIEKMDDARSMLHRKARMGRIEEQRGYDLPVGRASEYEDVVGIPEVVRDWMLQPVENIIESMNLLPDFTTDTSEYTTPAIYTPASTVPASPMNVVFPGNIPTVRISDGGQVESPVQLPAITDRRVPIPKSILEKVAQQNRLGAAMSTTSSPRTGSTGNISQCYSSPQKVSYTAALSGGSPDGPKKALGLRAYIPKALEKVFGKGRSK